MKKLLALVVPCFFLAACTGHPLARPEPSMVVEIRVSQSGQETSSAISQKETIEAIYEAMSEDLGYGHDSISEPPVDDYLRFELVTRTREVNQAFYLYEEEGRYYLEEPYYARWRVSQESYDRLMALLKGT